MYELAKIKAKQRKVVFTKTLTKSLWDDTELATGDLQEEIHQLKKQSGKDIIVYGGSSFVSALTKQGLIDEFHFFVNPTALGKGASIFQDLEARQKLSLKNVKSYESGLVLLHYEKMA
ncbi:MAG: dihydrofolate reductase family protein [Spirochaetota bacterium]